MAGKFKSMILFMILPNFSLLALISMPMSAVQRGRKRFGKSGRSSTQRSMNQRQKDSKPYTKREINPKKEKAEDVTHDSLNAELDAFFGRSKVVAKSNLDDELEQYMNKKPNTEEKEEKSGEATNSTNEEK